MIRTPVTSSFITSIGHDGTRIEVELANGNIYVGDVTPEEHAALVTAKSIGKAFNAFRGRLTKLEPEKEQ